MRSSNSDNSSLRRDISGPLPPGAVRVGNTSSKIRKTSCASNKCVKDESGCEAVFAEQSPSASPVTRAKVLHAISRLPRMAGEANDAISAYTQVKMKDASSSRLLSFPQTECPTVWIRLPRDRRQADFHQINDPVVPLESSSWEFKLEKNPVTRKLGDP